MARKSHSKRKRAGTLSKYERTKAGQAFGKALKSVNRVCRGKKATTKICRKAVSRLLAAKKRVTKIVGYM